MEKERKNEVMDIKETLKKVTKDHPNAAIGGGIGAAVGAMLGGPIGAGIGGAVGGYLGSCLDGPKLPDDFE